MRRFQIIVAIALAAAATQVKGVDGSAKTSVSRADGARTDLALTIYNSNLGLVKETRTLTLEAGLTELRYMDVAAQINPRTVHMASLTDPKGLEVLEQNYEYDLISPEKLMERFLGREVTLVFGEGGKGEQRRETQATLVSNSGGMVYEIDGRYHVNPDARVILPEIPGGLISAPTLVWLLRSAAAGPQKAETSYLTGGISWSADYVGVISADDAKADLTGWVTIDNNSGATYKDATLKLVAGDVHRVAPEGLPRPYEMMQMKGQAAPAFAEEAFFEYHLYTLERRATVKDRQTKQVALMEAPGVPVKKIYLLRGEPSYFRGQFGGPGGEVKVGVSLELLNSEKNGLGMPLPQGTVRLYKQDASGSLQFIGEDSVKHTPKDEKITLKMGDAFDVVAERTQTDFKAVSAGRYDAEVAFQINIRNHKDEAVTVVVREPVAGDWKILTSSHPPTKADAHTIEFSVPVPKNGEAVLSYRVAVDWS